MPEEAIRRWESASQRYDRYRCLEQDGAGSDLARATVIRPEGANGGA